VLTWIINYCIETYGQCPCCRRHSTTATNVTASSSLQSWHALWLHQHALLFLLFISSFVLLLS